MHDVPEAELVSATPRASRRIPIWVWLVGGMGFVFAGMFLAVLSWVYYIGIYGPETWVYAGNQVPKRFVEVMSEVGALDEGETIVYFYSDAMTNIRDGFYFVSDKKVVVYSETVGPESLTVIGFDQIDDITLDRDESAFSDSQISIYLKSGQSVSFPLSSEYDRDEDFFEAISKRVPDGAED